MVQFYMIHSLSHHQGTPRKSDRDHSYNKPKSFYSYQPHQALLIMRSEPNTVLWCIVLKEVHSHCRKGGKRNGGKVLAKVGRQSERKGLGSSKAGHQKALASAIYCMSHLEVGGGRQTMETFCFPFPHVLFPPTLLFLLKSTFFSFYDQLSLLFVFTLI